MSTPADTTDRQALLKRALLEIKDLRAKLEKLEALDRARSEPIAIIGIGCRFPGGADDPESLWRLLREGAEVSSEVPKDRWDVDAHYDPDPNAPMKTYSRRGSFIDQVDQFDPQFFNMSPREALSMDPQQRLFLEVAWEALENAGQAPDRLAGTRTGVFAAAGNEEYAYRLERAGHTDAHTATGNIPGFVPGRLSFLLGLSGPSISLHTTCSTSLVAIHLACQSLRTKECDMALAGGGSLMLSPFGHIALCKIGMMARDGRSKSFDATGDGYGRGEGCGVIVLKRLSDALENGDRIQALIRGSAVNQDGSSSGVAVPNGAAQQALIREALTNARVDPAQVSYMEAHGTGTPAGDPIEVRAIGAVLGKGRSRDQALIMGAVKANIGHLELGAGVASVIKVALALQHREIPPQPSYLRQRNPAIPWDEFPLTIPTKPLAWAQDKGPRIAGVNSLGGSGTNAHLVMEEAPPVAPPSPDADLRPLHLLALSAKTEAALTALAARYEQTLAAQPGLSLADVCFTAGAGRAHFKHRLALVAGSAADARAGLAAWRSSGSSAQRGGAEAQERGPQAALVGEAIRGRRPKIAFFFHGAAPSLAAARHLYETQPTFRKALQHVDERLREHRVHLLDAVLAPAAEGEALLAGPAIAEPALFGLSHALTELWRSWGIEPSAVFGEGTGEYLAACVARIFSLEDGIQLAVARGRLRAAQATGAADQALDALEQAAHKVRCSPASLRVIASVTGQPAAGKSLMEASYWRVQAQEPARLAAGMRSLADMGCDVVIDIGLAPARVEAGRPSAKEGSLLRLPSPGSEQDAWRTLLQSVGALYVRGAPVDFARFDRDYPRRRLALPTYPFQRERYYLDVEPDRPHAAAPAPHAGLPANAAPPALTGAALRAAADPERALVGYLSGHVARMLLLPSAKLDTHESLKDLGLNSLMYAELKKSVEADLSLTLSLQDLLKGPSVSEVTAKLIDELSAEKKNQDPLPSGTASPSGAAARAEPSAPEGAPDRRWISQRAQTDQPTTRLFCFPHAGGGASIYRTWAAGLLKEVEVCAVQLPGREERIREAPLTDLSAITDALLPVLLPLLDRPFAFYGHSMGALLSFEIARKLRARGAPSPRLIVAAACTAPHRHEPLWRLPDEQISEEMILETLGTLDAPPEFLASPELKEILLPTIRADLRAVNAYAAAEEAPLDCRILALCGARDRRVSREQASAWREQTSGSFTLEVLPGNHLFMNSDRDLLLETLSRELRELHAAPATEK